MRLFAVLLENLNGPQRSPERFAATAKARQVLGRFLLCAAILCFIAARPPLSSASSADRAAGAEIFKEKGCEHCHGATAAGTDKGPALTTIGKRMHKDQIQHQIQDGGKQMPPFGDVLSDDEMHKLVDYLAHMKKAPKTSPAS